MYVMTFEFWYNSRLSISELNNFRQNQDLKFLDLVSYDLSGNANLGLSAVTSINGSSAFPSFSFDIAAGLPIFNYNNEKEASSNGTTVNFNNIQVDLGTFLTDFAQPILKTVDTIIEPIKPVIDALTTDTEFLGYIGLLESAFDKNDDGEVNVLEIAQTIAESVKDPRAKKIVTAIEFANTVIDIVGVVEELADIPEGESIIIDVGDYSLGSFKAGSKNKANSASKVRQSSNGATFNDSGKNANFEQDINNKKSNGKKSGSALSILKALEGIDIPLISSPVTAVQLLLGESDVDLLTYDIPDIDFGFDVSKDFQIWGPVQGVFKGDFSIDDNEIKVVTDFKGSFTFEETFDIESLLDTFDTNNNQVIDINEGRLAAVGGTDTSSGLPVVTPLFAIPDSNMITPLTMLKAKLAELGTEAETAESLVKTALDLPLGIDLNNFDAQDAIARGDEKGTAVYIVHIQVQNLITQVTGLIQDLSTATPEASAEAAIEALATALTASGDIVNISNTQQLRATIVPTIKSQIQLLGGTQHQEEELQSILDEAAAIMAQANQDILDVAAQAPIDSLIDIIAPVKRRTQGELPQQILELATTAVATSSTENEPEVNGGSISIETTELISLSTNNNDNQNNTLEQDTVEDTQQIPLTLTQQQSNLLLLGGDSTTASLEFSLTQKNLTQGTVHEVAVFAVENEQAQINGLLPTDVGYKQAALESAEVVFSVIADNFVPNPSRIVSGFNGNNLAFLIVENGSVDGALNGQVSLDNVLLGTDSSQVLQINQLAENSFSLTFNDLVINAELTDKTPIMGTNLQGKSQAEVFDLRDFTGQQIQVAAPIVEGESMYDNTVGFYSVEDETGAVRDPLTGNVINPGEVGYIQAAIRNSQLHLDETSDGMTVTVTGGAILAPFIIANGTTEQILDNDETNDPSVYFAYIAANSDQVNHIRLLGDNTWGFEDLRNGGDKDYNDVVIKMDLTLI